MVPLAFGATVFVLLLLGSRLLNDFAIHWHIVVGR